MAGDFVFTSGSVTPGHPDKLCDQISDALVDSFLREEPGCRVTAESAITKGILFLAIRFSSAAGFDVATVARDVIARAGYTEGEFAAQSCSVMTSMMPAQENGVGTLSAEADDGNLEAMVAEQNVTLFGYACRQSPGLLPLPIWLAHRLARSLAEARINGELGYLAPDGQTQVAVEYSDRRPRRIHSLTILSASLESADVSLDRLRDEVRASVVPAAFEGEALVPDANTRIYVNPRGLFPLGGPYTHAGLTGRKTAIDTYGEFARHSGAALSGKDPGRIDRVGAYAARHAAKNVVAAGLAEECEVQLSYAIGQAQPVSMNVESFGTGRVTDAEIAQRLLSSFDFCPAAILRAFNLRSLPRLANGPFFERLAVYGQVGRTDLVLPWESTDQAKVLAS